MPNGRVVKPRTARAVSTICAGAEYAPPMQPSPPAFDTAATRAGVSPPPAIGAWMTGALRPKRSRNACCVIPDDRIASMSEDNPLGDRGRAFEEDYFRKRDRELIEKMRKASAAESERREIGSKTGLQDPAI